MKWQQCSAQSRGNASRHAGLHAIRQLALRQAVASQFAVAARPSMNTNAAGWRLAFAATAQCPQAMPAFHCIATQRALGLTDSGAAAGASRTAFGHSARHAAQRPQNGSFNVPRPRISRQAHRDPMLQ
jgi:hypothetical protein